MFPLTQGYRALYLRAAKSVNVLASYEGNGKRFNTEGTEDPVGTESRMESGEVAGLFSERELACRCAVI